MKKIGLTTKHLKTRIEIPGIPQYLTEDALLYEYQTGEFITREMDDLNYLYVILNGTAKILATQDNGKQIILQFLHAEDLIGELTIIKVEETVKSIVAMTEVTCLAIPIETVEKELLPNPDFLYYLAQYIGKKLLFRVEHFKEQQTQELKIRLAKLMLEISPNDCYCQKHTEISEYLGVSYRHFMHTFKFFKDKGYIKKEGKEYSINRDKLNNFIYNSH